MKKKNIRKALCSYRISAHPLKIERGQNCGLKPEERLCDTCKIVEDEIHCFSDCSKYIMFRKSKIDAIKHVDCSVNFSSKEDFVTLMSHPNVKITQAVGNFILKYNIS